MSTKCVKLEYAKLYMALNHLKLNDEREIIKELNDFKGICINCFNLINSSTPPYTGVYMSYIRDIPWELPILSNFFGEIKDFSCEAYQYITDGYDILNLKEFLLCKDKEWKEASDIIWGIYKYSKYISYAIEKLLKEKDWEKQIIMLKGLTGVE